MSELEADRLGVLDAARVPPTPQRRRRLAIVLANAWHELTDQFTSFKTIAPHDFVGLIADARPYRVYLIERIDEPGLLLSHDRLLRR